MKDVELLKKEIGSMEERIEFGKRKNIQFLRDVYGIIAEYFRSNFGITSEKLQENFRKISGKTLPNWFLTLELIAIHPDITADDISNIIGVSERTIYKNFNELQEKGLVERVGGRKEGYWQIIKQE